MIWTKRQFELGAARLHAQCEERKKNREPKPKAKRRLILNSDEMRYLAQLHSIADGSAIDKNADVEIYMTCRSKCYHVIITSDKEMYKDGWMVNSVPKPDIIHYVNQHDILTNEAIKILHKQFERSKKCIIDA